MCDTATLFSIQSQTINLGQFENELATIRQLHARSKRKDSDLLSYEWLNSRKEEPFVVDGLEAAAETCADDLRQKSKRLREEGNKMLNAQPRSKQNALAASRLYTSAILTAPADDCETLALAHANRGMALQQFGYFRQAYDDCVCALDLGYPMQLRHKVVARQATCALHLGEVAKVRLHLEDLDAMTLNENFTKQSLELRGQLEELLCRQNGQKTGREESIDEKDDSPKVNLERRQKTKIMHSPGPTGRYMVAAQPILKHELIFDDYAASFVPVANSDSSLLLLCQQCSTLELIPFPCHRCRCRVVYCSLQCRTAHAHIHAFECAGYRRQIFANIGVGHLALRALLEGLPPVLARLRDKSDAQQLWTSLVNVLDPESVASSDTLAYAETLRLVHHFDTMDVEDVVSYALMADLLLVYLKEFTEFFNLTADSAASRCDWELITAALIMRHIGQFIVNSSVCTALVPLESPQTFQFTLLQEELWAEPLRVQRGCLHKISHCRKIVVANFPYLSVCNHACKQSFQSRFSGRFVSTFAADALCAGDEITNCYTLDHQKSNRHSRRAELQQIYNFDCVCHKCESVNPDADYNKFNRFRCEHRKCAKVFIFESKQFETDSSELPKCTNCGKQQRFELLEKFRSQLECVRNANCRSRIFDSYEQLDKWFLDYNEMKVAMASTLVLGFLEAISAGAYLSDVEFDKLVQISKFALDGIAAQSGAFSIEYVSKLTYLWDLIALGKYKCTLAECKFMLNAVAILSDEFKTIFMNYYEDYIKH